jgi:hypothetical protein
MFFVGSPIVLIGEPMFLIGTPILFVGSPNNTVGARMILIGKIFFDNNLWIKKTATIGVSCDLLYERSFRKSNIHCNILHGCSI